MRQSITTKYLGPTNSKGARVKAIARKTSSFGSEMSATVPFNYEGTEQAHCAAAKACAEKLGWSGLWVGGSNLNEDGYVFVSLGNPTGWGSMGSDGSIGVEGRDWFFISSTEA